MVPIFRVIVSGGNEIAILEVKECWNREVSILLGSLLFITEALHNLATVATVTTGHVASRQSVIEEGIIDNLLWGPGFALCNLGVSAVAGTWIQVATATQPATRRSTGLTPSVTGSA